MFTNLHYKINRWFAYSTYLLFIISHIAFIRLTREMLLARKNLIVSDRIFCTKSRSWQTLKSAILLLEKFCNSWSCFSGFNTVHVYVQSTLFLIVSSMVSLGINLIGCDEKRRVLFRYCDTRNTPNSTETVLCFHIKFCIVSSFTRRESRHSYLRNSKNVSMQPLHKLWTSCICDNFFDCFSCLIGIIFLRWEVGRTYRVLRCIFPRAYML